MTYLRLGILTLLLAGLSSVCLAATPYSQAPGAKQFIQQLVDKGFNADWVATQLDNAKHQESIIKAISSPAEHRLTWGQYRAIFLTQKRVKLGVAFWQQHQPAFKRAESTYGVPAAVILAVLGVETYYGRNMGDYRVLDALATLGFDYPPRADFFRKQLSQFFLLTQEANLDLRKVEGSYAGAIGYGQFIPSSYRAYAVDFNHDGTTDLVNSPVDAIGSIANYFAVHHWQADLPVASRAKVGKNSNNPFTDKNQMKPQHTLQEAKQAGVQFTHCDQYQQLSHCLSDLPDSTPVSFLHLDGSHGTEYWVTTDNFYTITRYNHSILYAMAVYQLAEHIAAAIDKAAP